MSQSQLPKLTPSNGPPRITYQDFSRGSAGSSVIGVSASGLVVIASLSRERVRRISVVGTLAMVGVWNDGVGQIPCWAFALASGDVGWAPEAFSAVMLVSSETAKSRLGSVRSPSSSALSPIADSTALTRVKFTPIPLTSIICSPSGPVAIAKQIGRLATCSRFALLSRAF
eukprot:885331-Pleurochrysis_carterae.AAC.1